MLSGTLTINFDNRFDNNLRADWDESYDLDQEEWTVVGGFMTMGMNLRDHNSFTLDGTMTISGDGISLSGPLLVSNSTTLTSGRNASGDWDTEAEDYALSGGGNDNVTTSNNFGMVLGGFVTVDLLDSSLTLLTNISSSSSQSVTADVFYTFDPDGGFVITGGTSTTNIGSADSSSMEGIGGISVDAMGGTLVGIIDVRIRDSSDVTMEITSALVEKENTDDGVSGDNDSSDGDNDDDSDENQPSNPANDNWEWQQQSGTLTANSDSYSRIYTQLGGMVEQDIKGQTLPATAILWTESVDSSNSHITSNWSPGGPDADESTDGTWTTTGFGGTETTEKSEITIAGNAPFTSTSYGIATAGNAQFSIFIRDYDEQNTGWTLAPDGSISTSGGRTETQYLHSIIRTETEGAYAFAGEGDPDRSYQSMAASLQLDGNTADAPDGKSSTSGWESTGTAHEETFDEQTYHRITTSILNPNPPSAANPWQITIDVTETDVTANTKQWITGNGTYWQRHKTDPDPANDVLTAYEISVDGDITSYKHDDTQDTFYRREATDHTGEEPVTDLFQKTTHYNDTKDTFEYESTSGNYGETRIAPPNIITETQDGAARAEGPNVFTYDVTGELTESGGRLDQTIIDVETIQTAPPQNPNPNPAVPGNAPNITRSGTIEVDLGRDAARSIDADGDAALNGWGTRLTGTLDLENSFDSSYELNVDGDLDADGAGWTLHTADDTSENESRRYSKIDLDGESDGGVSGFGSYTDAQTDYDAERLNESDSTVEKRLVGLTTFDTLDDAAYQTRGDGSSRVFHSEKTVVNVTESNPGEFQWQSAYGNVQGDFTFESTHETLSDLRLEWTQLWSEEQQQTSGVRHVRTYESTDASGEGDGTYNFGDADGSTSLGYSGAGTITGERAEKAIAHKETLQSMAAGSGQWTTLKETDNRFSLDSRESEKRGTGTMDVTRELGDGLETTGDGTYTLTGTVTDEGDKDIINIRMVSHSLNLVDPNAETPPEDPPATAQDENGNPTIDAPTDDGPFDADSIDPNADLSGHIAESDGNAAYLLREHDRTYFDYSGDSGTDSDTDSNSGASNSFTQTLSQNDATNGISTTYQFSG
ncbi:MAG: hypothetical protein AAFP90_10205, partial [Planctomycetota bacterium]